ncbi:hypothetical protein N7520_007223 [Penicillium odoratum]|uniref:uncharacterized protein n=1 Tax=Penicillium odoratum TaxID=1167516 RepID=UPI00254836B2|nr:uncharacterized protein N7520_007223 [Penicillium odoratum]KAJ5760067.1 hypothetical protein N7520_007223 [Penicillium odoratum]
MQEPSEAHAGNMLASSATGTTFLILIQLTSRIVTFGSNQLILRTLSPLVLGVAAQLELYQVTILYFSRESIRMAIQRQPMTAELSETGRSLPYMQSTASQSVVNVSYLSLFLGVPSTIMLTILYRHFAPMQALILPFFEAGVIITGVAALLELSIEPFFAIVQQRMWYEKRAAVEMPAAFIKSLVTCSAFLYASQTGRQVGILPFALGHLSYSLTLIGGYCLSLLPRASERRFSYLPAVIKQQSDDRQYLLGCFSRRLTILAASVFIQSIVKHLLTQGDSMILAALSSLEDQGIYSLASNYGGLIARVIFQPLEESSRNLFSTLLSPDNSGKRNPAQIRVAKGHLIDLLRAYQLLSILIFPLGPIMVPQVLRIIGGSQWTSPLVGDLLSLYCYYIPFLAFNGITEAFVSSAANPREIQRQTAWMGVFSACYALVSYLLLEVWSLGGYGLVLANIVNMLVRTLWSYTFIQSYLRLHGDDLSIMQMSIQPASYILGILATVAMVTQRLSGPDQDMIPAVAFSFFYALSM